jgi:8-oxo-dGTP pyrophosphatase MutT (NUDIX family)
MTTHRSAQQDALARASFIPQFTRDDGYAITSESVAYKRYLTIYDRTVEHPGGHTFSYDIVGHPRAHFHAVWVFPFHSSDSSVTLLREYAQGPNALVWSLPAGGVDPAKHSSLEGAAQAELSEEALLRGGELARLLPAEHPGLLEAKWCANRWTPFLSLDAQPDEAPGARDAEEVGLEVHRVPVERVRELLLSGEMLPPSIITCQLALAELVRRGLLPS